MDCRPVRAKSQSVPARCQENRPECGSGNSDRGSLSSGPRAGGEDLVTACNRSWEPYYRFDERSYNPQPSPYSLYGWQQFGCSGVSGSYPHPQYPDPQYCGYTGYAASDHYPYYWPPLGTNSPMGTTARPPTWANCRYMDLPRLPAVSPRTRLWAPGWTRDIWAGVNMCSVERFRAKRGYQGFE